MPSLAILEVFAIGRVVGGSSKVVGENAFRAF